MLYHTINILLSTMCVVMRHWGTWHSSRWIKIVPIYWMVWHMLGHITNLSHWQSSFRFIVLKSYRLWIVFYWIAQASSSQISGRCSVVNACCYVAMSQLTPIIPFWGPVPLLALSSFAWDRFFNRRNLMFWNLFSLILDPILKFNIWLLYAKRDPSSSLTVSLCQDSLCSWAQSDLLQTDAEKRFSKAKYFYAE